MYTVVQPAQNQPIITNTMLGRLFARSAATASAAPLGLGRRPRASPSCRALCYSNRNSSNYWLSDKSVRTRRSGV